MLSQIPEYLLDALIDSSKLIPFLLVIYIILELVDRKAGSKIFSSIKKVKKLGPFIGSLIGVIPQCGLSAAAATLFSKKAITLGTMLAVFLSASDDMLPILISSSVPILTILKILGIKVLLAVISGYIVDLVFRLIKGTDNTKPATIKMTSRKSASTSESPDYCTASCCRGSFPVVIIKHTLQVFIYIFILSSLLNIIIGSIGEDVIGGFFKSVPIVAQLVSALIGLIPNCASSVIITELYVSGVMSAGALFSGLLVNAGVGLLILVKENKNKKENVLIIATLYVIGIFWGVLIDLFPIF